MRMPTFQRVQPFLLIAMICGLLVLIIDCANPIDDEPLKWRTVFEIPITNRAFNIANEFPNMFKAESLDILNSSKRYRDDDMALLEPDSVKGDTVMFSVFKRDTSRFEIHQARLDEKTYTVSLGAIAISNAPDLRDTISIPAIPGAFSVSQPITFDKIYRLTFSDTVTNFLLVLMTNLSSTPLTDLTLQIDGLGSEAVGLIDAGETVSLQFDVRGRTIYNSVPMTLSGTSTDGGVEMVLNTTVNGLHASSLSVDDHLVSLKREFINKYELTDTVNIDYVDIRDGFIIYEVTNHTGIELRVRCTHEHLWISSFAERNSLDNYKDLFKVSSSDSALNHLGYITSGEVIAPPKREQAFSKGNFSQSRLYAVWDSTIQKSVTKVRYEVSIGAPTGDTITLNSSDNLIFTIRSNFKYRKLAGTVMVPYKITSDTELVPIKFPWGETAADSLKGRFILKNVYGDVRLKTSMAAGSFLDSVNFNIMVFVPDSPDVKNEMFTQFTNVGHNSSFKRFVDITDVVNRFPDSLAIVTVMHIPRGTRIVSENDLQVKDDDYDMYIGKMNIGIMADYRLNAKLDWEVKSTVNMDLGSGTFKVVKPLRYINKLDQVRADFILKTANSSNLNITLFALIAPEKLIDTLELMSANEVFHLITNKDEAEKRGLVNFLGSDGVHISPNTQDSVTYDSVYFNDSQLNTILSSDSCSWRWLIQFLEEDRDALLDTDSIKINSLLHVDGINCTDSLIIW